MALGRAPTANCWSYKSSKYQFSAGKAEAKTLLLALQNWQKSELWGERQVNRDYCFWDARAVRNDPFKLPLQAGQARHQLRYLGADGQGESRIRSGIRGKCYTFSLVFGGPRWEKQPAIQTVKSGLPAEFADGSWWRLARKLTEKIK